MKSNVVSKIVAGACAVLMIASVTACGKSNTASNDAAQTASSVAEQVADAAQAASSVAENVETAAAEGASNVEEEISNVQDTLVFMGGLKTADGADKVIDVAMFRNEEGDIIYIYEEDGNLDYGMFTSESAKTDDGKEYSKVAGNVGTFGYYFNEDLVSGIIVDTTGKVYEAVELDEAGARDYVSKTIGG